MRQVIKRTARANLRVHIPCTSAIPHSTGACLWVRTDKRTLARRHLYAPLNINTTCAAIRRWDLHVPQQQHKSVVMSLLKELFCQRKSSRRPLSSLSPCSLSWVFRGSLYMVLVDLSEEKYTSGFYPQLRNLRVGSTWLTTDVLTNNNDEREIVRERIRDRLLGRKQSLILQSCITQKSYWFS